MEPDEGHDIEIEYIPYPEFDRFVELEKYVTKSQKVCIKWLIKNDFLPADNKIECPECVKLFALGKFNRIGKLVYVNTAPSQRRKGILSSNL